MINHLYYNIYDINIIKFFIYKNNNLSYYLKKLYTKIIL